MKNILIALLIALNLIKINAQDFNGSIEFKYYTLKDTTRNVYFVKNKIVKLDNYVKFTPVMEGSYIFDLPQKKMKFVSHKRKLWGEHANETPPLLKGVYDVVKGKNTRSVAGIKCREYIVKNNEENTIITYWIADEKFTFFSPMMKLWNSKYKQSIYFIQIKDLPVGSMPLLSEEKRISDGKAISKLEVIKVDKKTPQDANLEIPAAYNKVE